MTPASASNLRTRLRRYFIGSLLCVAGFGALSFAVDYAAFRLRAWRNWNAYDAVTVNHYYGVAQKNGKTQFIFDPPASQMCVNALFPHSGQLPCWYLRRHPDQRTDI